MKGECSGGCYRPRPHRLPAPGLLPTDPVDKGVRIASNGVNALAVAAAAEQAPTQTVAKAYNISVVEVLDARRWSRYTIPTDLILPEFHTEDTMYSFATDTASIGSTAFTAGGSTQLTAGGLASPPGGAAARTNLNPADRTAASGTLSRRCGISGTATSTNTGRSTARSKAKRSSSSTISPTTSSRSPATW